jgi:hypothetical protein
MSLRLDYIHYTLLWSRYMQTSSIKPLGYVQFQTHRVYVSHDLDSDNYLCFKSTESRCDLESFTDIDSAVDYILEPLTSLVYYVKINGDPEP